MQKNLTYLDYAATTPIADAAKVALLDWLEKDRVGNASATEHVRGSESWKEIQQARLKIATALSVRSEQVVFTSGATESNNLCILGLRKFGADNGKRHIISTAIEHKAVTAPLKHLSDSGFVVDFVRPGPNGRICADDVRKKLRSDTLLVSVMHANNETGTIQPIEEIAEALQTSDAFFHVDAAQTFMKLTSLKEIDRIDFISISAHKISGPQGIGALIGKSKRQRLRALKPLTYGGGQERGLRPGTYPVALIAAFGAAVDYMDTNHSMWERHCRILYRSFSDQIRKLGGVINGDAVHCLPNILNFQLPGIDADAYLLANRGRIIASKGSACTTGAVDNSHVLTAMGLSTEQIQQSIRFSWGIETDEPAKSFIRESLKDF